VLALSIPEIDFLLHPRLGERTGFQREIDKSAWEECQALLIFLRQKYGNLPDFLACDAENLCGGELFPYGRHWKLRVFGRLALAGDLAEANAADWRRFEQIEFSGTLGFPHPVHIMTTGGFVDIELKKTYHPSVAGSEIEIKKITADETIDFQSRIGQALNLLARVSPSGWTAVCDEMYSIGTLSVTPDLVKGQVVSLAISAVPGVIFTSMTGVVHLAETILHECAHCRLSAASLVRPLWKSSKIRLTTPLRPDPRPLPGLYHQTYVLFWLNKFFTNLIRSNEPLFLKNEKNVTKRKDQVEKDFYMALDVLRSASSELTDIGREIMIAMAKEGLDYDFQSGL